MEFITETKYVIKNLERELKLYDHHPELKKALENRLERLKNIDNSGTAFNRGLLSGALFSSIGKFAGEFGMRGNILFMYLANPIPMNQSEKTWLEMRDFLKSYTPNEAMYYLKYYPEYYVYAGIGNRISYERNEGPHDENRVVNFYANPKEATAEVFGSIMGSILMLGVNPPRKTVNFYTEGPKAIYVNDGTPGGTSITEQTRVVDFKRDLLWIKDNNFSIGKMSLRALAPGGKVLYENNFLGTNALMQIGNTVKNAGGTIPLIGYNGSISSNSLINGQMQASNFHSPKYPVVTYNPNAVALSTVNYFNPILNNHDSGLGNITYNSVPFVKGNIGGKIVSANSYVLKVPSGLQNDINQVVNGRDDGGFISERILVTTLNKDPNWEVFDGKYRYNNGFDVVARNKMTGEVWILESKQIENAVRLPVGAINGLSDNGAGGYRQLSQDWINEIVNNKFDRNNIARQIVEKAIKENNLNTGITGINRKTGELIIMPVKVQNK